MDKRVHKIKNNPDDDDPEVVAYLLTVWNSKGFVPTKKGLLRDNMEEHGNPR